LILNPIQRTGSDNGKRLTLSQSVILGNRL